MTEPDVTLTDYALGIECLILCGLALRGECKYCTLGRWLGVFFAAGGAAALLGGTVHGFFLDQQSLGHAILWRMTLIAVAVATLSLWAIGASLLASSRAAWWIIRAAVVQCAGYIIAVLLLTQAFWLAMLCHVPAVLFVLFCLSAAYHRTRRTAHLVAGCGVAVMLLAGILQQLHIAPHPTYFTHNALYHVVQMLALAIFYAGMAPLTRADQIGSESSGASHAHTP